MKRNRNQHGFTLMEATMAMVILAIAASGIFMSFAAAASVQTEAQRRITASRLAADLIEQIAATTYGSIQTTWSAGSYSAAYIGYTDTAYEKLSCNLGYGDVSVDDGGTPVNLIQITVVAKYNNQEITRITTLIGDQNRH
jgi:prepilin-type N-terminal cleavage/methylation domain-containing protein